MTNKGRQFQQLFKQKSFLQFFDTRSEITDLFNLLDEVEIDHMVDMNVQFIRSCSPSSAISIEDFNLQGKLTLINFDSGFYKLFTPDEFIAVLLHEIGHFFNPNLKEIEAEYAADEFAKSKGYGKWIITGLEKGLKNRWIGFEKESCELRINKLRGTKIL